MRKWILYILIAILLVISIISICLVVLMYNNNSNIEIDTIDKLASIEENTINNNTKIVTTSYSSTKISPNANFIFQTYYKGCNHIVEKQEKVSSDLVNNNEFEIDEKFSDWDIKKFTSNEVIFYKEVDGVCKEDYIIKEQDGSIVIFTLSDNGIEELYKTTNIQTQYLPEEDLAHIKKRNKGKGKRRAK